jgi:glycosyltransferase involved in cell wall biosynthesis
MNNQTFPNIHLWIPNIFEFKGGIQVYSAFLLQALQNFLPQAQIKVFLKHDRNVPNEEKTLLPTKFYASGHWPLPLRTLAFSSKVATAELLDKPNLILTTHLNFAPLAHWLKNVTRTPYWAVAHGVDAWNIQNLSRKQALHHADRVLAVSHYTRNRLLQEQNLDPSKVVVLPNTFDAHRFKVAPKPQHLLKRYHLNHEQPVILTVARLDSTERYKGYDQILLALPEIRCHVPNVQYLIIGKGTDHSRIEQIIEHYQLEDCVTLAGFIPDEELCDHYNLCDVFAMPSKGEGFGIVFLEALACGKPALGGDCDGALDALDGGNLGVLVNPDNIDVIAQKLIQILKRSYQHPLLYQPEALRQSVIDLYGFKQFQTTLESLWQTYLGSKS